MSRIPRRSRARIAASTSRDATHHVPRMEWLESRVALSGVPDTLGPVAASGPVASSPLSQGDSASFDQATGMVNFDLAAPALTTAAVFDAQGKVVRTLFSMQPFSAGQHSTFWDGKDDAGNVAPAGNYTVEIVLNRSDATNVGAIGSNAKSPNLSDHMPATLQSVAVDPSGAIYTANGWDEAGADFKKWDAAGNSIYDAQYRVRNNNPNGLPDRITTDGTYMYLGVEGAGNWSGQQWIERYRLSDGMPAPFTGPGAINGHIRVYDSTAGLANPQAIAATHNQLLQSLAVSGNTLYVADAGGNRVLMYDKNTGAKLGQFSVTFPQAIAVDASGRVWVAHNHGVLSLYKADGKPQGDVKSGLGDVASLAFGPAGKLYVANTTAAQVQIYTVSGTNLKLVQTLGHPAQPGSGDPSGFYNLRGAAVDALGNIITIQNEPAGGAQLAKWAPNGTLIWRQFSNEFVSLGNYGQDDPSRFYSLTFHVYNLTNPSTGSWQYVANAFPGGVDYSSYSTGVPRVLDVGGKDFYFMPTGDGLQVYRIDGNAFHLATLVGGRSPAPDGSSYVKGQGEWSWSDVSGTGVPASGEIRWFQPQGLGTYDTLAMSVDSDGDIWFVDKFNRGVWEIPLGSLDARGNPTYDWASAHQVIAADTSSLGFLAQTVQHADDGSTYVLGWSAKAPQGQTSLWMGGTTLAHYDAAGHLLWTTTLPEISTGMDVIPGGDGGVMVGGGISATIYQYTSDGLLIGSMKPGAAMGNSSSWLDTSGSVAVNRNPVDGKLDVFVEDDLGLHIGWYRVNDLAVTRLTVSAPAPSALTTAPTDVVATATGGAVAVVVSWTATAGASSYTVERSADGVHWTAIAQVAAPGPGDSAALSVGDTGLLPGTTYQYRVGGLTSSGTLAYSTSTSATTGAVVSRNTPIQGDFSGGALPPGWTTVGGTWQVADGTLSQTFAGFVPEAGLQKAIYTGVTDSDGIMITAKIRVDNWNDVVNGLVRVGVGLGTDPVTGEGWNLTYYMRNGILFYDDNGTWGVQPATNWSVGQWMWFRLASYQGTLYANVWADGTAAPTSWSFMQTGWTNRTSGSPALIGGKGVASATFEDVQIDRFTGNTVVPTATPTADGQVVLSWMGIPTASSYTVERSLDGTTWDVVDQVAASLASGNMQAFTFADRGLLAGTTYKYRVVGRNGAGALPYSDVVSATTIGLLAKPAASQVPAAAIAAATVAAPTSAPETLSALESPTSTVETTATAPTISATVLTTSIAPSTALETVSPTAATTTASETSTPTIETIATAQEPSASILATTTAPSTTQATAPATTAKTTAAVSKTTSPATSASSSTPPSSSPTTGSATWPTQTAPVATPAPAAPKVAPASATTSTRSSPAATITTASTVAASKNPIEVPATPDPVAPPKRRWSAIFGPGAGRGAAGAMKSLGTRVASYFGRGSNLRAAINGQPARFNLGTALFGPKYGPRPIVRQTPPPMAARPALSGTAFSNRPLTTFTRKSNLG